MAKGDDIQERLIDFAVRIINLCDRLPNTRNGSHVANQLIRCGTAPAAHYAEARSAESTKDFIHKLKLCNKELNEARVWITLIIKSKMQSVPDMQEIIQECDELCRITNASINTARKRS